MSSNRWMVYKCNKMLLSHKKNEMLTFATAWMELEKYKLSEINQMKDKYKIIWLKHVLQRSKTGDQMKSNKNKLTGSSLRAVTIRKEGKETWTGRKNNHYTGKILVL